MKIYLGIKFYPDMSNRRLIETLLGRLEQAGHKTSCAVRDLEDWGSLAVSASELMTRSFTLIENSDWVLLEVSEKGMGLGIEAGFAFAKGIPVLAVSQQADFSTTLQGIAHQTLRYQNIEQIVAFFRSPHADVSTRTRDPAPP